MRATSSPLLRFGEFTLDRERGCLRRADTEIALRPRTYAVLCHLAVNAGRLVGKDELFASLWRGMSVTDDALVQCIAELRHALEDHEQLFIRTVPRRGYRFVAAVAEQHREQTAPLALLPAAAGRSLSSVFPVALAIGVGGLLLVGVVARPWWEAPHVPDRPRVAVLAFAGADDRAEQVADALGEHIVTELVELGMVDVRSLSTDDASRAMDGRRLGRLLDVDYLVDGTVEDDHGTVRVIAHLIDTASDTYVWSARWDRPSTDVLGLEAAVAEHVAQQLRDLALPRRKPADGSGSAPALDG